MESRIKINEVEPAAYQAMGGLEQFVKKSSLDPVHKELIKVRASQINGCAFCLDLHTRDARRIGVSEQKLFLVSAWREAGELFTDEERLLLRMTEEITLIHQEGLSDKVYNETIQVFGEHKTAEIIMAIVTINGWNRIAVSTHPKFAIRDH